MARALTCTYTPTDHGTKDAFTCDGQLYRVNSRYALARVLLAASYDPQDMLALTYRDGRLAMNPRTLADLARWEISDGERRISIRQHRPDKFDPKGLQKAPERVARAPQEAQSLVSRSETAKAA